ncbi:hypothetical protein Q664_45870 [Archangium violaceum Cb vi76]|uniref:Uncharacterized protein n=2 Tax=Archangium violaceum TaxID=83451 RepID=A0A084SH02_9BACT|nr:hypothetical protein Q664_45870 [Archangium violaceum Cb vi76]
MMQVRRAGEKLDDALNKLSDAKRLIYEAHVAMAVGQGADGGGTTQGLNIGEALATIHALRANLMRVYKEVGAELNALVNAPKR